MTVNKEYILNYLKELGNLNSHIDTEAAAETIKKNVHFRGPNVYILAFAIIIASVGLNINSIPVIIGAMLISPLMGPIIGFGMGVGTRDIDLIWSALRNLAVMVTISIVASTLYFLVTPLDLTHPTELLARTNPSIYDVFIALFGGFAGILETSRKEKGTVMSGVAIATALMPPLCTAGYGIANGNWHYALGAIYLFLLNGILIATATYVTVKLLHFRSDDEFVSTRRRIISALILILVLLVPSVISAIHMINENNFQRKATEFVEKHHFIGTCYVCNSKIDTSVSPYVIEFDLTIGSYTDADMTAFYDDALKAGITHDQIVINDNVSSDYRNRMSDEDMMRQLIQAKTEQIEAYKTNIEYLQNKVTELETIVRQSDKAYLLNDTIK